MENKHVQFANMRSRSGAIFSFFLFMLLVGSVFATETAGEKTEPSEAISLDFGLEFIAAAVVLSILILAAIYYVLNKRSGA